MALRTHRSMTRLASTSCMTLVLLGATSALAAVTEPGGLAVPIDQALSKDYWDTTKYNTATLGIQSLLDAWEGQGIINAYADASATNVIFSPLCGLSGSMILRGGSCQVDFGWYCTSDPVGQEVIHPLVTKADVVTYHDVTLATLAGKPPGLNSWADLKNDDKGFVPTIQSGILKPVVGSISLENVRTDPNFLACASQQIGFAFAGATGTICPMSKFSEPSRNQMSTFGSPWINAVVYESKKYPGSYYIAFEDMPTAPGSFTPTLGSVLPGTPSGLKNPGEWATWTNDGDFNDFVFKVDGILCIGGGLPCTPTDATGAALKGACSLGVTACSVDGTNNACTQKIVAQAETCNGWDDDCNGAADDGEELCPTGQICDNGQCVGSCGSGEFPCSGDKVCKSTGRLAGYCVSADCANVECPEGERCNAGTCVGACVGVTCPANTQCLAGACIDLCAGVECPNSYVCEMGTCIPNCTCMPCTNPAESCDVTATSPTFGHCIDSLCVGKVCEAFKTCLAGDCVDPCAGNPCGTATCTPTETGGYSCPNGSTGVPGTGNGGAGSGLGTSPGLGTTPGSGNAPGSNLIGGENNTGCACRMSRVPENRGLYLLSLLGLSVAAMRLSRRGRRN